MRRCSLTLFAAAAIGLTATQVVSAADLARRPPAPAYVPPGRGLLPSVSLAFAVLEQLNHQRHARVFRKQ